MNEPQDPTSRDRKDEPSPPPASDGTPGVKEYVSVLKTIEQQVGDHVVSVLQQPDTVAVMTTVVAAGDGTQRIVSVGLDADALESVQQLFEKARDKQEGERTPCVGFHCFIKDRKSA